MLVVHGARELKLSVEGLHTSHERAAARTPGLDGRDEELAATMAELLALPTVAAIDDPAETVAALRGLGVVGRAEFVGENRNVLTHLREDGDLLHLYLYHFLYETGEPVEVEVALPGVGAVHRIDGWTGRSVPHPGVRQDGERTIVAVTLAPGETALLTLDRSAEPAPASAPAVSETVAELPEWTIAVESWDAGEPELITEDRGLGYETREVRPTTAVTRLEAGTGTLRPWRDLAGGRPGGLGGRRVHHHAALDGGPQVGYPVPSRSRLHRRWPRLGSGQRWRGEGLRHARRRSSTSPRTCGAGDNTVTVRVASSLNNRLLARGYYEKVPDIVTTWGGNEPRCRPPRCTITACSARSGSCARRPANRRKARPSREPRSLTKASRVEPLLTNSADGSGVRVRAEVVGRTCAKVAGRLPAPAALRRSCRMWWRLNERPRRSLFCSFDGSKPVAGFSFLTVCFTEDVDRGRPEEGTGHRA